MKNQDEYLLERAYLSISQPMKSVPADKEEVVLSEPVVDFEDDEGDDWEEDSEESCGECGECEICSSTAKAINPLIFPPAPSPDSLSTRHRSEEQDEDDMVISNLSSIRDSINKVSGYCATGGHLETWQQYKLAIAMDNLAEVARRLS